MNQLIYSRSQLDHYRIGFDHVVLRVLFKSFAPKTGELDFVRMDRDPNHGNCPYINLGDARFYFRRSGKLVHCYAQKDLNGYQIMRELLRELSYDFSPYPCATPGKTNFIPIAILLTPGIKWRKLWRKHAISKAFDALERFRSVIEEKVADTETIPKIKFEFNSYAVAAWERTFDAIIPVGIKPHETKQFREAFRTLITPETFQQPLVTAGGIPIMRGQSPGGAHNIDYLKETTKAQGSLYRLESRVRFGDRKYRAETRRYLGGGNSFNTAAQLESIANQLADQWDDELHQSYGQTYQLDEAEVDEIFRERVASAHPRRADLVLKALFDGPGVLFEAGTKHLHFRWDLFDKMRRSRMVVKRGRYSFVLNSAYREIIRKDLRRSRNV